MMSSMRKMTLLAPVVLATTASAAMQAPPMMPQQLPLYAAPVQYAAGDSIGYAIADWRRLRQSNGYAFDD